MAAESSSNIAKLIDTFMSKVAECSDDEDWKEADGWVGKWTIGTAGLVYEVKDGKFIRIMNPSPDQKFTGEVMMSEDTFIDLMKAALREGRADEVFAYKYGIKAIQYKGEQWIVDSERFRKVLKRLALTKKLV